MRHRTRLGEGQGWNAPIVFLVLAACGGDGARDIVGPPPPTNIIVEVVDGDAQIDTVAQQLAVPIRVRVLTDAREPVRQQIVNFVVVSGGGSVFAGSALTDANGEALERWTLGTTAGAQTLEARAVDQDTGQPITLARITATALPGPAAAITLRRQDTTAFLNAALDLRAVIQGVTDAYGNAIADPVPTATGAGTYSVANGVLTATAEGDLSLTLRVDAASALVVVRARRDLRALATWRATYGCRNGYGRMSPTALEQRHGMSDWVLLSYDATLQVDSVRYGTGPMEPSMRYDAVVWVSGSAFGQWQKYQGAITDTLTQPILSTPLAFWQRPDSLVFRNAGTINNGGPASIAVRQGGGAYTGADWCFAVNNGLYEAGIFRGNDSQPATEGSFVPLLVQP